MANRIYDVAKQGFLFGVDVNGTTTQIRWGPSASGGDNFRVALVNSNYSNNVNTTDDRVLSDIINVNGIISTTTSPTGFAGISLDATATNTDGTAFANSVTFTGLPTDGTEATALVVYREFTDSGTGDEVPSESILIAYIDQAENLPLILNGVDVTIDWDSGQGRVFQL